MVLRNSKKRHQQHFVLVRVISWLMVSLNSCSPVGVNHVFVNGVQVLKDDEHTDAKRGRALWGRVKSNSTGFENTV